MAIIQGDLVGKIAATIRKTLPRMYNKEIVFLERVVTTDAFGAKVTEYVESRRLPAVVVFNTGLTANNLGNKEWDSANYAAHCISSHVPKLRDKLKIEGIGQLDIVNIQQYEDVLIMGLAEEQ